MIDFPPLKPTSRRVTQGQFAVKRFTTISGTGTTRAYSSQPFNSSLDLTFENVPDSDAHALLACYEQARGSYSALHLPSTIWSGVEPLLHEHLQRDYIWRFAEQPQLTSGRPGISTVTLKLDGQRDG